MDLKYVARQLLRRPGHTLAVIACLVVGLVASVGTFSVITSIFYGDMPGIAGRASLVRVSLRYEGRGEPGGGGRPLVTAPLSFNDFAVMRDLPADSLLDAPSSRDIADVERQLTVSAARIAASQPDHARQRRAARPRSRLRPGRHADPDHRARDRAAGAAAHRARDRLRERGQPAPGPRRGTVARARRSAGARGDPRPARAIAHPRDARARADRRRSVDRAHPPDPRTGAGHGAGVREHRLARVALRGLARARGLPGDRAHARVDRAPPHGGRRAQTGLTERRPSPLAAARRADRRPGRTVARPDGARGALRQNRAGDGQRGSERPSPADGRHASIRPSCG